MYYLLNAKFRHLVVRRDTELVIEGFPRCANTFAVVAFEKAQSRPVTIAHHLHAQAQIANAIDWHIPVLVLVREPFGAVASLLVRHPNISENQAMEQYERFYGFVQENKRHVVIADFHNIAIEYSAVILRINSHFGTSFAPYWNSASNDADVFAAIDRFNLAKEHGNAMQLARPSVLKAQKKEVVLERLRAHGRMPHLQKLYGDVVRHESSR